MKRFKILNKTEVLDTQTDLIWQRQIPDPMDWGQAMEYAKTLGSGWRLPTIHELFGLINFGKENPASDFPDMPSVTFWSSSFAADPSNAWYVSFDYGHVYSYVKSYNRYVRCVRAESLDSQNLETLKQRTSNNFRTLGKF